MAPSALTLLRLTAAAAAVGGAHAADASASASALPAGARLGSAAVESAVSFRNLDSFWRGNSSHVDFYNVRLAPKAGEAGVPAPRSSSGGKGGGLSNMVLQVFLEDAEEAARVRARLDNDLQLLPYKQASMALGSPDVEIVTGKLDPTESCGTVWDGSTFFDSPWFHNVYHLHAKNVLPTAVVIATAPSLVPGAGPCTRLPCREQLPRRTLFHFQAPSRPLMLANVQTAMFDEVHDLSRLTFGGGSHCFRHLNWGYGGELTSVDGYLPDYVHEVRVITQAVREFAVDTFVKDAATRADLHEEVRPEDRATASPRVLWISRQPKDTEGMVQTGRNRWIKDPDVVEDAWVKAGAVVDSCCDWNKVDMNSMMAKIANADIVYGLHGAGLGNSFYSRKGNVLVEIVGNYGGDSLFYTRVAAASYGDWLRVKVDRSNAVGEQTATFVAECAVALWRNAPDVEEICGRQHRALVRTTHDMLKVGTAESLPLEVDIAPCDTSPRCRMAALKNEGHDMMTMMKLMRANDKPEPPARGSGKPGRVRHSEL